MSNTGEAFGVLTDKETEKSSYHTPIQSNREHCDEKASSQTQIQQQHQDRGQCIQDIMKFLIASNVMEKNPAVDVFSFDILCRRLKDMMTAFPEPFFNHACAVKANPIRGILKEAQKYGLGAECASYAEAVHSLSLGFPPRKIVYDSPCKTIDELRDMIIQGVYINLDNIEEIAKVNTILKELGDGQSTSRQKQFGLRINPVVGGGAIAATSTATVTSKFGLPYLKETETKLLEIFKENPWLQGVHVHVGSQGCSLDLLVAGVQRAVEFAESINLQLSRRQIQVIDIGGGLPTDYDSDNEAFSYSDYSASLRAKVPLAFSGKYDIITEFGRSLFAKAGFSVTRVEAIKDWAGQRIAVTHLGANQFLRVAYLPNQWHHRFSVFKSDGTLKQGEFVKQDIAGPLCFSGDFIGKQVMLPFIETGDYIAIHDTAAYTMSMYSKYNSNCASAVYAYEKSDAKFNLYLLKERETLEENLRFWGLEDARQVY